MTPDFRIWIKKEKEMARIDSIANLACGQIKATAFTKKKMLSFQGFEGDFELMQWTGSHDAYRKKIYEGDIIKGESDNGVVRYNSSVVSYIVVWRGGDVNYLRDILDDGCVIIGNIYENPELLEVLACSK